ncbi:hypothetical protein T06_2512 [Trichinella sp. T6]|nr:hypothetical protein T06_2512 [Trichinella sp. T6]
MLKPDIRYTVIIRGYIPLNRFSFCPFTYSL